MKKFLLLFAMLFVFPNFASATSGACSSHNGVNCSVYSSSGKAVCNDGWVSSVYYWNADECLIDCSVASSAGLTCASQNDYNSLKTKWDNYVGGVSIQQNLNGMYGMAGVNTNSSAKDQEASALAQCLSDIVTYTIRVNDYNSCINKLNLFWKMSADSMKIYQSAITAKADTASKLSCYDLINGFLGSDNKCYCNTGYNWDSASLKCVKPSCYDMINGYLSSDNKCYCNTGYKWDSASMECLDENPTPKEPSAIQDYYPEGAMIRAKGEADIFIVKYVGNKSFKRLILSPSVFKSYGHLKWENVKDVDFSVLDLFTTSDLVRAVGDDKVYMLIPEGDTGEKRQLKDSSVFSKMNLDTDSIYEINSFDRDSYITGNLLS